MRQFTLKFLVLTWTLAMLMINCFSPYGFPSQEFKRQVLTCASYEECEKANAVGMKVYHERECDLKKEMHFIYEVQYRQYCVDQKMYIDITKQKMENYKKK